jgi:GT2 family glycosyltransferase
LRLSVLVVSHNTRELLAACLDSLAEHLTGIEHEVCVVDNASSDGSAALVRERFPHVRLLANDRNAGFAAGVNEAIDATTASYICWLNPDARLLNAGMAAALDYLDAHERVGILGPRIVNADGSIQHSSRSFPSYATALFNRNSFMTRLFPRNRYTRDYLRTGRNHAAIEETDWVSGACLIHRRALGRLDERFFLYMEDIDFCLRARKEGWSVVCHPALRVLHHIGGSSRRIPVRRVLVLHRSIWRYYKKHFRCNLLLDAVSAGVIWGRCAVMIGEALLFGAKDPHTIRRA